MECPGDPVGRPGDACRSSRKDSMTITIEEYDSYDDVEDLWRDLNRRYKGGELAVDIDIHRELWERFHAPAGAALRIIVASENGRCVGIVPLTRLPHTDLHGGWVLGEDAIIAREYFCPPDRIHDLVRLLPPHGCTDLSCFYTPARRERFVPRPGCVVDLLGSEDEYMASLKPRQQAEILKTREMNRDVEVVVAGGVLEPEVAALRDRYIDFWMKKVAHRGPSDPEESREKILVDFALLGRAEALSKLVALYLYLGGRLVAANFSIRRESDRLDDYMCLRDTDDAFAKRRLGIFAIIENMSHVRRLGVRYYDLSDFRAPYKDIFINKEDFFYWCPDERAWASSKREGR